MELAWTLDPGGWVITTLDPGPWTLDLALDPPVVEEVVMAPGSLPFAPYPFEAAGHCQQRQVVALTAAELGVRCRQQQQQHRPHAFSP